MVDYVLSNCTMGSLLTAGTGDGLCSLKLGDQPEHLISILEDEFEGAQPAPAGSLVAEWTGQVVEFLQGKRTRLDIPLDVGGTPFQRQVWQALQQIPYGETRTYRQLAQTVGRPRAVRAVANACASNPVAVVVPCHRVVRSDGGLGGYYWGIERKRLLLKLEEERKDAN